MEDYIGLLKKAQKQVISRDNTISIKDLAFCHRKKVFSKMEPVNMTDEELYDYVSGQAAHDVIERLFMVYPGRFRVEKELQYKNLKGKMDIHDKALNNIVEIKMSKTQKILLRPFKFHEKQIRYYMSIMDSDEGHIMYQINHQRKYITFPIYMDAEERKQQLRKMEEEGEFLRIAIEARDPSLVQGIYDDEQLKWMCLKCPYLKKCESMRNTDTGAGSVA
jgi:hypothetical protein